MAGIWAQNPFSKSTMKAIPNIDTGLWRKKNWDPWSSLTSYLGNFKNYSESARNEQRSVNLNPRLVHTITDVHNQAHHDTIMTPTIAFKVSNPHNLRRLSLTNFASGPVQDTGLSVKGLHLLPTPNRVTLSYNIGSNCLKLQQKGKGLVYTR